MRISDRSSDVCSSDLKADLARETAELTTQPGLERQELADIYMARGLDPDLALKVADQLMADDALGAHARDELGISDISTARPLQAAFTYAATFSAGALMPLAVGAAAPGQIGTTSWRGRVFQVGLIQGCPE